VARGKRSWKSARKNGAARRIVIFVAVMIYCIYEMIGRFNYRLKNFFDYAENTVETLTVHVLWDYMRLDCTQDAKKYH